MCTREAHDELKTVPERVLRETTPVGVQVLDGELLGYLRNCSACTSTLLLTPEQHAVVLAQEGTT
jgi:hypothetical protein